MNEQMRKQCFGEYCAFNDDCDSCHELNQYCKMWKNNTFNFKRRRNLMMFICFIIIVVWNVKIGSDLLKTDFKALTILSFSIILFSFLALGTSIRSRKIAMEAYQESLRASKHTTTSYENIKA